MHRSFDLLTCDMKLMNRSSATLAHQPNCVESGKSCSDRLQRCDLLSIEFHKIEHYMHTVFKLIHGLYDITVEDAGLSLCSSITRGSGVCLKQGHAICNLFKYRAPHQWNSLPLNIAQCTNFISFKCKLFVYLQENDISFFKFKHIALLI